jgi:hypothetical protein
MFQMTSLSYMVVAVATGLLGVAAFFLLSFFTPYTRRTKKELLQERTAYNPNGVENIKFKRLLKESSNGGYEHSPAERYLSVIIPAMNEEVCYI